MNANIEITNINKHFLLNNKQNQYKQNQYKQDHYKTKIVHHGFYTINEANISDKIKKIRYYSNHYAVVEDYDFIQISQLNEKTIEKLNLSDEKKYILFKYRNDRFVTFRDFLHDICNPKLFVLHTIESFSYLLHSLEQLHDNNICFFNLSPQNIVFNLDCGKKPILTNFNGSLQISKLNESYISKIINNATNATNTTNTNNTNNTIHDYTHKPLEVHILFYLIKNDMLTLSYSFIEEVCEVFANKLSVLNIFSDKYRESYKAECAETLKKYINKPRADIISDILEQHDTWDVYSISLLYLHIFGNLVRVFSLKQPFISKIVKDLAKNLHPDPRRRVRISTLLANFETELCSVKDWSFVNNLPHNKMPEFMEILGK